MNQGHPLRVLGASSGRWTRVSGFGGTNWLDPGLHPPMYLDNIGSFSRKTKGTAFPSDFSLSNSQRCSFSCLAIHSLVALEKLKLTFNIGRGRILILTRKLTNPHGSLFLGYWPLWWFPGSSASSYRGISGSDWRCTQLGCSTGRWTHRGRG